MIPVPTFFRAIEPLLYSPRVDGGDDSAAIAEIYARGILGVRLQSGYTYKFDTTLHIPNGGVLSGYGATIHSTIPNLGFGSYPINIDMPDGSAIGSTTLASTPATNATSISINASVTAGQIVALARGTSYEVFTAGTVTGTGPYTVQLLDDQGQSRALRYPFASGDTVEIYAAGSRPHDITVEGITFTGSGAQCIECSRAIRIIVRDCVLAPDSGVTGLGFDLGCEDCTAERVFCRLLGNGPNVGIYGQSNLKLTIRDCSSEGAQIGFELLDCWGSEIINCRVQNCSGYGYVVGTLAGGGVASFGCIDCAIRDCTAFNCATGYFVAGSTNALLDNCTAESCSTDGTLVTTQALASNADRTLIRGCKMKGCGVGALINSSITNTVVRDLDASACTIAGMSLAGDTTVDGFTALGMGVTAITITATNVRLSRLNVVITTNGVVAIQFSGTRAWVSDSEVTGTTSVVYYLVSGTLRMKDCKAIGSGGSTGLYVTAACTANLTGTNDLDGAATPLNNNGTTTIAQVAGESALTVTSADVTLTYAQAVSQGIATSGTLTADRNVVVPNVAGAAWDVFVNSTGGHNTTFKTPSGTGITVATGKRARLKCDGTNVVRMNADT